MFLISGKLILLITAVGCVCINPRGLDKSDGERRAHDSSREGLHYYNLFHHPETSAVLRSNHHRFHVLAAVLYVSCGA